MVVMNGTAAKAGTDIVISGSVNTRKSRRAAGELADVTRMPSDVYATRDVNRRGGGARAIAGR
jgi:hypothetical protein